VRRPGPAPSGKRTVEVVLGERDAGICFERDAAGRPVVRGLTASAQPDVARGVAPGMRLSRIAGVKCKAIDYDKALELVRALERPLKLTFKAPSNTNAGVASSSSSTKTKKKRRRASRDDDDDDDDHGSDADE